jgi:hypothetical protein
VHPVLTVALVMLAGFLGAGGSTFFFLPLLVLVSINLFILWRLLMSKIVSRKIRWDPVPGSSGFKVYFGPTEPGLQFTYESANVNVGVPPLDVDGKHVIFLNSQPELAALPEGNYDFAVTAYDEAGNESDFAEVENVPLDLVAPNAPTGVEVVAE